MKEYNKKAKEQLREDTNNRISELRREMIFLTRSVGKNPLSIGYYTQIKDLLEDLMMLELAQRAAEVTIQFQTINKIISIDDRALAPFRAEMEKAKTLKMITGILSITGCLDTEDVLSKVTTYMYGPKMPKDTKTEKEINTLNEIKKLLDDYARKIEKSCKPK